eukprot:TRINITY_DN9022_c0_g1_i1.p1 TRINITY_DN9022_c0_g1~~TRINITY_DN9022_c0_g1_i1.p1  ORF type:complete len:404 (+),score=149.41 TRINITY_DN9022_c0_g1_i1:109-1320(+)
MSEEGEISDLAKGLVGIRELANSGVISKNGKSLLKEMILRQSLHEVQTNSVELIQSCVDLDAEKIATLDSLITTQASHLFETLYSTVSLDDGKKMSRAEREQKGMLDVKNFVYGEVGFRSFVEVLSKIITDHGSLPKDAKFCDLGSGTGRAVFIARFMYDFSYLVGIEYLETLHGTSMEVAQNFEDEFRSILNPSPEIDFINGSFIDYDWSDSDVVFANSTCFDDELMKQISSQAELLKAGSYLITFTKPLPSKKFERVFCERFNMSWGPATVYIHQKMSDDQVVEVELAEKEDEQYQKELELLEEELAEQENGNTNPIEEEEPTSNTEDDDEKLENELGELIIDANAGEESHENSSEVHLNDEEKNEFETLHSPQGAALLSRKRFRHQVQINSSHMSEMQED